MRYRHGLGVSNLMWDSRGERVLIYYFRIQGRLDAWDESSFQSVSHCLINVPNKVSFYLTFERPYWSLWACFGSSFKTEVWTAFVVPSYACRPYFSWPLSDPAAMIFRQHPFFNLGVPVYFLDAMREMPTSISNTSRMKTPTIVKALRWV